MDDEQIAFVVLLHAWDGFVKTLESEYITDCMKRFASCYGIPENCRLVKIFGTFEAGMSAGLDLALKTENYERNNAQ